MAAVRRHWALVMAAPLLLLSILFAVFQHGLDAKKAHADAAVNSAQSTAQASPTTRPATLVESLRRYRHIQGLRSELALTTQDLAALGVSSTTAQQIFAAVKAFHASSISTLGTADANYQIAKHALQTAMRSINVGSGNSATDNTTLASLPTLQQTVNDAAAQRAAVMAPLISQINGLLSSDQQAMWQTARINAASSRTPGAVAAPGAFRYAAGLTSDQIHQLDRAARRGGVTGLQTAAAQVLTSDQTSAAQTAMTNQQMSMAGVATAEAAEFPMSTPSQQGQTPATPSSPAQ